MSLGSPSTDRLHRPDERRRRGARPASKDTLFVIAAGNTGPTLNTVSSPGCAPGVADRRRRRPRRLHGPLLQPRTRHRLAHPQARDLRARRRHLRRRGRRPRASTPTGRCPVRRWPPRMSRAPPPSSSSATRTGPRSRSRPLSSPPPTSDIPGDVRETGGGRLDVKAAIDQTVLGAPAVQGGTFNWPQDKQRPHHGRRARTPTLRTKPVKLKLRSCRVSPATTAPPSARSVAKLGEPSVTVPAGATVKVPLQHRPDRAAEGRPVRRRHRPRPGHGADGVNVSTPFSLYVEPETVTLRVKLDRPQRQAPAAGSSSLDVIGTDTAGGERRFNNGAADQIVPGAPRPLLRLQLLSRPGRRGHATLSDSVRRLPGPAAAERHQGHDPGPRRPQGPPAPVKTERPPVREPDHHPRVRPQLGRRLAARRHPAAGGRSSRATSPTSRARAKDGDFEFGSFWRRYAPQVSS